MASSTIRALWAKAVPDRDPEVMAGKGKTDDVAEAYAAARISLEEVRRLEGYLARRDERHPTNRRGDSDV